MSRALLAIEAALAEAVKEIVAATEIDLLPVEAANHWGESRRHLAEAVHGGGGDGEACQGGDGVRRSKKIHHESRRFQGTGYEWAVSDCYRTTPRVEMTTDWSKVDCRTCLKARRKETA